MIVATVLVGLIVFLVFRWWRERQNIYNVFKTMGIPGPEPTSILLGNLPAMGVEGQHKTWAKWAVKYGKTYGYFEGPRPVLVTSDVDLLKNVFVKEFHKFNSRKPFPLDNPRDKFKDMFMSYGHQWKRLRAISSPSFSSRRMKEMSPLIKGSISELLDVLDTRCKDGKPFDIHGEFQRLTLTVIASCAFGMDVNAIKEPNHLFLQHARKIFAISNDNKKSIRMMTLIPLALAFPSFVNVLAYLRPIIGSPKSWFLQTSKRILESRMNTQGDRVDFVRLMLDAKEASQDADLTMTADDTEEPEVDGAQKTRQEAKPNVERGRSTHVMTMEEMQAQSMLFLLAGYETTSTALGFTAYLLALHPEAQRKLQEEIDEHFPSEGALPEYSSVQKLPYLDMVLDEVLRMYPIATIALTRKAMEDCDVGDLHIPRGMSVQADLETIHHDPTLWGPEDPYDFVPERFTAERKQSRHIMAWMPFGAGPRNCVGMRFALLEAKLALVTVLRKYVIERCDETQIPLPLNKNAIKAPSEGVLVRIVERSS